MQRQQTRETPPGVKIGDPMATKADPLPRIAVVTRNTRRRLNIDTAAMAALPITIDNLQALQVRIAVAARAIIKTGGILHPRPRVNHPPNIGK